MSERLIRCDICQRILPENTLISEDTFNLCKDTKACDDWMDNNLADFEVTLQGFAAERQENEELQAENTQLKAELNEAQGKLQEWGGADNYLLSTDLDKANEANAQLKAEVAELMDVICRAYIALSEAEMYASTPNIKASVLECHDISMKHLQQKGARDE